MNLKDKVVVITGTNNPEGIGAAIAKRFFLEGAKLVLVYKKLDYDFDESLIDKFGYNRYYKGLASDGSEVFSELENRGADFLVIEADITKDGVPKDIFNKAIERYGRVDCLINNAAEFSEHDSLDSINEGDIDLIFQVNTKASILLTKEFLRNYKGDNGHVLFFSTDAAQNMANQIIYGASKAANESLTRSLAVELGPKGITVNCIAPGPTQTGWIDKELEVAVLSEIPTGKLIQPSDIANTAAFLCSDDANQLTGQVIKVSGGHNL